MPKLRFVKKEYSGTHMFHLKLRGVIDEPGMTC